VAHAFEPVRKSHDRASFTCGEPSLDDWFRKRASQDDRRNVARVFVAVDRARGHTVVGFYSLSTFTLALDSLPGELARKLPRFDAIPAALIGRLARSETVRGQSVGELLVVDAIKRVLAADPALAIFAIVVESMNDRASEFYRSFGFVPFPESPRRLFLLTSTARAALS
jgi:ribosomal protein S18 acetylase RimI-like enzyme